MNECTALDLRASSELYQIPFIDHSLTYSKIEQLYPLARRIWKALPETDPNKSLWTQRLTGMRNILLDSEEYEEACLITALSLETLQQQFEAICSPEPIRYGKVVEAPFISKVCNILKVKDLKPVAWTFQSCERVPAVDLPFPDITLLSSRLSPLTEQERIQLEAIAKCVVNNLNKIRKATQEESLEYTKAKLEYEKWEQRFRRSYNQLSEQEQSILSQCNLAKLNQMNLLELQQEFRQFSFLPDREMSAEQKICRAAIARYMQEFYLLEKKRNYHPNLDLEYQRWHQIFVTVKEYRKQALLETSLLGRKWRGITAKQHVTQLASQYERENLGDLLSRGEELFVRWQEELSTKKQREEASAQKIHLIPDRMLRDISRLTQGCLGSSEISRWINQASQNDQAHFFPFSTSSVYSEQGFVGKAVNGQWLLVEPQLSENFSSNQVIRKGFDATSTYKAFYTGEANNSGTTAMVIFRDAKVYTESGQTTIQPIVMKNHTDETGLLPQQEWEALKKVQGMTDVIQALGVLIDPKDHHISAIILPRFSGSLVNYQRELNSSSNTLEERQEAWLSIFSRIAEALTSMHAQGYYHLDLKLDNILINYESREGKIVFSDLAISDLPNIVAEHRDIQPTRGICFQAEFDQVQLSKVLSDAEKQVIRARMDIRALGLMLHNTFASFPYPTTQQGWLDASQGCQAFPEEVPVELQDLIREMLSTEITGKVPAMSEVVARLGSIPGCFVSVSLV